MIKTFHNKKIIWYSTQWELDCGVSYTEHYTFLTLKMNIYESVKTFRRIQNTGK